MPGHALGPSWRVLVGTYLPPPQAQIGQLARWVQAPRTRKSGAVGNADLTNENPSSHFKVYRHSICILTLFMPSSRC